MIGEREEPFFMPFTEQPVINYKYSFGSNSVIQTHRCKKLIVFPYSGNPSLNQVPHRQKYFNTEFLNFNVVNGPLCFISIAKRGGGYHFLDLPILQFSKNGTGYPNIHDNLRFDMEVDMHNSYLRFNYLAGEIFLWLLPFVVQINFRLIID